MRTNKELLTTQDQSIHHHLRTCPQDGMLVLNGRGQIISSNHGCLQMFGYSQQEMISMSLQGLLPQYAMVQEKPLDHQAEITLGMHKRGNAFPVKLSLSSLNLGEEEVTVGFLSNMTNHLSVKKERNQLSTIVDRSLSEVYMVCYDSLKILSVNRRAQKQLGYDLEEVNDMNLNDFMPSLNDCDPWRKNLLTEDKSELLLETIVKRKNGSAYPMEFRLLLSEYHSQKAILMIGQDISRRKELEKDIALAQLRGQERSYKRLFHRIDEKANLLFGKLKAEIEDTQLSKRDKNKLLISLDNIIDNMSNELLASHYVGGLNPSLDLEMSILKLCDRLKTQTKLELHCELNDLDHDYGQQMIKSVFKIVAELMENVVQHAEASHLLLDISRYNKYLMIKVRDDGKGFDPGMLHVYLRKYTGFDHVMTNIKSLCGTFQIDSKFDQGTEINIALPLSHKGQFSKTKDTWKP